MVVLLTSSLLLAAFVAFALPRVSGVSLVSLAAVVPLATLVLAGRHSMRQQTLTVLSWAMGGAAVTFVPTVVYSVVVLTLIQGMTPIVEAPLWGSTSWSISPDLPIALAIGAVAGLRWPDRLLMPRYRFETSSWPLRVLINVVAIVLVEFLVGLVVVFPIVWSINYWSYWDQPPFSTLTAAEIPVLDILKLAVVAIVLVIAAKSRGIAVETQRVLLWGVIGMVIWFVAAVILQAVLSWAAMSLTRDISEYYAFGLIPVTQGLVEGRPQSVVVLSWMGLTIGVWVGLGWPGGLMVPRWLSGDARTSGDAKNLAALAIYSVCAMVVFWVVSSVVMVLVAVVLDWW